MDRRQSLIEEREETIAKLEKAEKCCFFSGLYPGSHEPTQEGFFAAQANSSEKKSLPKISDKSTRNSAFQSAPENKLPNNSSNSTLFLPTVESVGIFLFNQLWHFA